MNKVYLAGAITGLTYEDGKNWREIAQLRFKDRGIKAYSPLRGKEYLKKYYNPLPAVTTGINNPLSTHKGIVTRDIFDVRTCDAMLVNLLGAERVSIGTVAEIGAAYALNKPMVLVMEKEGNIHQHGFILEMCGFHVETLEEGISILDTILNN